MTLVPLRNKQPFLPGIFHMEEAWNESLCDAIRRRELMLSTSTNWKSFILTEACSEAISIADEQM